MRQAVIGVQLNYALECKYRVFVTAFSRVSQTEMVMIERLGGVHGNGLLVGQDRVLVHTGRFIERSQRVPRESVFGVDLNNALDFFDVQLEADHLDRKSTRL